MENSEEIKTENINNFGNWKKNIILFFISQAISLFGSALVQYSIIWYITLTTQSGVMMTISTLVGFIPQILISVFAGVWADRYNKKMLIIISDSCIAVSTLIIAILFSFGIESIWLLFIALGVRSLGGGVQTPAVNSIIPQIVPEDKLIRANGVNTTIQSIMLIISPAAAGALMGIMSIGNIFFIDVITAIIGVSILTIIKIKHTKKIDKNEKIDYYKDIKEGIRYVRKDKFLNSFFKFYAALCLMFGPVAFLTPLLIARNFGDEVWRLTTNEIVFSVGSILGGITISVWGGFKNKVYTVGLACVLFGISMIIMGIPLGFIMFMIIMLMAGVVMPMFNTPSIVILQEVVEKDMQGRVFSLVQIVSAGLMPLSMILYGPLADKFNIEILLVLTGVVTLLIGIGVFYSKNLRLYETKVSKEN